MVRPSMIPFKAVTAPKYYWYRHLRPHLLHTLDSHTIVSSCQTTTCHCVVIAKGVLDIDIDSAPRKRHKNTPRKQQPERCRRVVSIPTGQTPSHPRHILYTTPHCATFVVSSLHSRLPPTPCSLLPVALLLLLLHYESTKRCTK